MLTSWMHCVHTHMKTVCTPETRTAVMHAAADVDLRLHAKQAARVHTVHDTWEMTMSKRANV